MKTIVLSAGLNISLAYQLERIYLDHRCRIQMIEKQIAKENLNNQNYQFLPTWVFLLPTLIENTTHIFPLLVSQNNSQFKLELWESKYNSSSSKQKAQSKDFHIS